MSSINFSVGTKSIQGQLSKLTQVQDLAYSYGIMGNTLSAFECFANRCLGDKSLETNIFSAYNNFNCGNIKTLEQLRAQMICQLTIMEFSFQMYVQSYGQYDYDKEMSKQALIDQLIEWRSWVLPEDKKYYDSAITIVNGGKPIRYTDELKGDGKINPNFLSNSVHLISNANKVGTDAVQKYKETGEAPKMKLNSKDIGDKNINVTSKREDVRKYEMEKLDKLLSKVENALLTLKKYKTEKMKKRENKRFQKRVKEFLEEYDKFFKNYQIYWYKDKKEKHQKKLEDFKKLCNDVERIIESQDILKEFANFCDPKSNL